MICHFIIFFFGLFDALNCRIYNIHFFIIMPRPSNGKINQ